MTRLSKERLAEIRSGTWSPLEYPTIGELISHIDAIEQELKIQDEANEELSAAKAMEDLWKRFKNYMHWVYKGDAHGTLCIICRKFMEPRNAAKSDRVDLQKALAKLKEKLK